MYKIFLQLMTGMQTKEIEGWREKQCKQFLSWPKYRKYRTTFKITEPRILYTTLLSPFFGESIRAVDVTFFSHYSDFLELKVQNLPF